MPFTEEQINKIFEDRPVPDTLPEEFPTVEEYQRFQKERAFREGPAKELLILLNRIAEFYEEAAEARLAGRSGRNDRVLSQLLVDLDNFIDSRFV